MNGEEVTLLVKIARSLAAADGSNPEYNRALIELVMDYADINPEARPTVTAAVVGEEAVIGVRPSDPPPKLTVGGVITKAHGEPPIGSIAAYDGMLPRWRVIAGWSSGKSTITWEQYRALWFGEPAPPLVLLRLGERTHQETEVIHRCERCNLRVRMSPQRVWIGRYSRYCPAIFGDNLLHYVAGEDNSREAPRVTCWCRHPLHVSGGCTYIVLGDHRCLCTAEMGKR